MTLTLTKETVKQIADSIKVDFIMSRYEAL